MTKVRKSFQNISRWILEEFEKYFGNFREVFQKFWKIIPKKISINILENVENFFGKFSKVFWKFSKFFIPENFMKYFVKIKICIKFWGIIW